MRPTIRQLEYLVALAETLHFGRAAQRVHVSQPGLSAQIKQLEQMLGVTLFERTRRTVAITPAGEAAAAQARRVLDESDRLTDVAQRFANPLEGALAMGVVPTVGPYVLPRFLPAIRRRYPALRLSLTEEETRRLVAGVRKRRLDLLLVALEADLGTLQTYPLFDDPFQLVVPRDHPLAKRKRVSEADLEGERVLLLEDGH